MTSSIPAGTISLTEAFDRFRLMRHGSVPELPDDPPADLTQFSNWEKEHLTKDREDEAALLEAFYNGQLTAFVWPRGHTEKRKIETGEWRQTKSPENLLLEEKIFVLSDDPLAKYQGCRPFVDETNFQNWLEANDPDTIHASRPRWGLFATLAWIATRNMKLSRLADQAGNTLVSIDILLRDWASNVDAQGSRSWPYRTASEAWEMELVPTLSAGNLKANAARTERRWDGGSEQTELGQTFPPAEAPTAAEHHIIQQGNDGPTLFPGGGQGAQQWVEWSRLSFNSRIVTEKWPQLYSRLTNKIETKGADGPEVPKVSQEDLFHWYERRVNDWPPKKSPTPTEKDDQKAAKAQFPGQLVTRSLLRKAREKYAPFSWRRQGPRSRR